jgi:hypothetical protein
MEANADDEKEHVCGRRQGLCMKWEIGGACNATSMMKKGWH